MGIRKVLKFGVGVVVWPLSILILLVGLLLTVSYLKSALLTILSGLIIFPPLWKFIGKRVSLKVPSWARIILFVVVLIISFETLPPSTKTFDTKITNQSASPTPAQSDQTTPEPQTKDTTQDAAAVAEAVSDTKRYEDMAELYCANRKTTIRTYPVLTLEEGVDGKAELKPKESKQGRYLTFDDCLAMTTALIFTNKTEHIEDIAEGKYWQGMDFFEIGYSLGTPDDRTTKTESGFLGVPNETEILTYRNGSHTLYLYLENKLLTKWSEDY